MNYWNDYQVISSLFIIKSVCKSLTEKNGSMDFTGSEI